MEILLRELDSIHPYENNPRINEPAIDKVADSIKRFGWQQPLVIDKDGVIVVGHTRFYAAQRLGLERVPCVLAAELTDDEVQQYRIADNKLNQFALWDNDKLKVELNAILGKFDPSTVYFSEVELDAIFNGLGAWESDIDAMGRVEAKDSQAKGRLVVQFDEKDREAVKDCLTRAIATLNIEGVTLA